MNGGGTIDGNGQIWWFVPPSEKAASRADADFPLLLVPLSDREAFARNKNRGVAGGSSRTFSRPIPLVVGNAQDVLIENISIVNSPFWHNLVYQSKNVTYDNIFIQAVSYNESIPTANSGELLPLRSVRQRCGVIGTLIEVLLSASSDGWDIYRSSQVTIKNSNINNEDDCVSLSPFTSLLPIAISSLESDSLPLVLPASEPNSTFIEVSNLICNGSHGISIGSLGQYAGETDIVSDVWVHNISMSNAQNGARYVLTSLICGFFVTIDRSADQPAPRCLNRIKGWFSLPSSPSHPFDQSGR
jgi:galacturan 1,4-alpha-galacturonidase